MEVIVRLRPSVDGEERHRALALSAQQGHLEVVRLMLDAAEDPNRFKPKGTHGHSTPPHQAVLTGGQAVVRLLIERGARLDIRDTVWQGAPFGWAPYGGGKSQVEMTDCLHLGPLSRQGFPVGD
jgi:hypothetical protein